MSKANLYRVYWTNHGYYSQEEFTTLEAAVAYGKSKFFEFQVTKEPTGDLVATWSIFGGLTTLGLRNAS